MTFIPKDYSAHWICLCQYHVKSTDGFRRTISAQFSGKSSIDIIKSTTNLRYVRAVVMDCYFASRKLLRRYIS